jgi:hypothetical protein
VSLRKGSSESKTLEILYELLGLYDSEAPIILHGVVSRGDFSQVQIVVSNTGTEDFALVDMGQLTFTVEQFQPQYHAQTGWTIQHDHHVAELLPACNHGITKRHERRTRKTVTPTTMRLWRQLRKHK